MNILKSVILVFMSFCSGAVISGGVFAFIAVIGIVPRLAQKTNTDNKIKLYETAITCGGVWGASMLYINYSLPIGVVLTGYFALCTGIFVGVLAVSLAEMLDGIPILTRRGHIMRGMSLFVFSVAIGKLAGSLIYYFIPGFFVPKI